MNNNNIVKHTNMQGDVEIMKNFTIKICQKPETSSVPNYNQRGPKFQISTIESTIVRSPKWDSSTLSRLSIPQLKQLIDELLSVIRSSSEELVSVLQERQELVDEVHLREVTIEQLLRLQMRDNEDLLSLPSY